jgi:formamidopyrimidine-DNA glycosylase
MPELPEVETIARILRQGTPEQPAILNHIIQSVQLLWERTLAEPATAEFKTRLCKQAINGIGRRGKFLLLNLTHDWLLFHLRMSGDLLVKSAGALPEKHDRLILELDGGIQLVFNDTRKFGRIWLVNNPQKVLGSLGPEPLDESLTAESLFQHLHATSRQLKPLLLDQTFLAGLGNIYVDEALNLSRLHPLTHANHLTQQQASQLLHAIRTVLRDGIDRNGASIDWVYRGGEFQNYFRVYQRTGEPCPACGTPIERITVGQRGTHFCPHCQPFPQGG